MMAVLYDPATGRFIQNCSLPLPAPLTPEDATEEDWSNALERLEIASGHAAIFGESQGNQKVVDGQLVTIDPTLEELKVRKTDAIDKERDRREKLGFPFNGKTFDSDERSVARITIAVQAAQAAFSAGAPFEITWGTADNTPMVLDAIGMMGVPVALAQYANELYETGKELKALVRSAATDTPEKISAIDWPELTPPAP